MKISKVESEITVKRYQNDDPPVVETESREAWADIRDITNENAETIREILLGWGYPEIRNEREKESRKTCDEMAFQLGIDGDEAFVSLIGAGDIDEMIDLVRDEMERCE